MSTGSYSLPLLADVDDSYLIALNDGGIALPGMHRYASNGIGSMLDLSALTTLTRQGSWTIYAQSCGAVDQSGLTCLTNMHGISINDTGSSILLDPDPATLNGISITTDGSDGQLLDGWTSDGRAQYTAFGTFPVLAFVRRQFRLLSIRSASQRSIRRVRLKNFSRRRLASA